MACFFMFCPAVTTSLASNGRHWEQTLALAPGKKQPKKKRPVSGPPDADSRLPVIWKWEQRHQFDVSKCTCSYVRFHFACAVDRFYKALLPALLPALFPTLLPLYCPLYCPLSSRLTALLSHAMLNEWLAFHCAFLNIQRSGVLEALFSCYWMVQHETAAVSVHVLCTQYNYVPAFLLHSKPHT